MADTKFVCWVCRHTFSGHRANMNPVDPEEDQIRCPECGSARIEPDHFDPNEPVEKPFEEPEQGYSL